MTNYAAFGGLSCMRMDELHHLLKETDLTMAEISDVLDISLQTLKGKADMTDTELYNRETRIKVHNVLGYDGSDKRDHCVRCGIIMIHDGAGIPEGWGEHQRSIGNLCLECMQFMLANYESEIRALAHCGCFNCGSDDVRIHFYQRSGYGVGDVFPYGALPYCKSCKERLYEENIVGHIRDFHHHIGDSLADICGGVIRFSPDSVPL